MVLTQQDFLYLQAWIDGTIPRTTMLDWCSGKGLDTDKWSTKDVQGTNTFGSEDAVNGGIIITTGATTNDRGIITTGSPSEVKHFQSASVITIFVAKVQSTSDQDTLIGVNEQNSEDEGVWDQAEFSALAANANFGLTTADGSTKSTTATSIVKDTDYHVCKIESDGTDVKLTVDGVLEVTKTTNKPVGSLAPWFFNKTTTTAAKTANVLYFETYDTTTVKDGSFASIYEMFNPLTTIAKQRRVEWFDGNTLNTIIWNFTDIVGTGSSAMGDGVDLGLVITTGATDDNESSINHNDIRQYSEIGAISILIAKAIANSRFRAGFSEDADMSNSFALVDMDADNTNYELATDDGTTESSSASSIAIDASFHTHKIENGSANIKLTIDGVLEVTKTTNRPDVTQQPFFAVKARSAGAKTGNISYGEWFNT